MGTPVSLSVPSYRHKRFAAVVSFIADHVNPETRMVTMRAKLDNASKFFKMNMHADVTLLGAPFEVLACPRSAIHEVDDKPCVYKQNGEDFEMLHLTVGGATNQYVEIVSGLKEGDKVVTAGANILR
jgi:multidrug efflux pump subunit AcrA (membrane-fusion protein)